jgi:hypothetical protein
MPPKMRKRWIHRSFEVLKEGQGSASPSGNVHSLGGVFSGTTGDGAGLEVRVADEGSGQEENERMEVDDDSTPRLASEDVDGVRVGGLSLY